jgi:putative heme-binding domain-containing protein
VIFAVQAVEAPEGVPRIVAEWQRGRIAEADRPAALAAIATLGNAEQVRLAFDVAVDPATPAPQSASLLGGMLESHKRRRTVPAGDLAAIERLVASPDDTCATRAIEATAAWRVAGAEDELAAVANAEGRSPAVRKSAITALGSLPGDVARKSLLSLCTATTAPGPLATAAIVALVPLSADDAAARAADYLTRCGDAKERTAIFQAFLSSKGGAANLAAALDQARSSLNADAVKDGQQAVSAAGRPEPELAAALAAALGRTAGAPAAGRSQHAMSGAELDAFVARVRGQADAARGKAIYQRENLKCVACHKIDRDGGRVGPNLTTIGAASPLDYIIDSLVDPAKNVKEGFSTLVVQTAAGQVLTGIQVSRSDEELVLRDATGKEVPIRVADIEEEAVGTTLMPAGLIDSLSREELADLVRYLSELGR